jgi:hypothetical protein
VYPLFSPSFILRSRKSKRRLRPFPIMAGSRFFDLPLSTQSSDCILIRCLKSPLTKVSYTRAFIQCIGIAVDLIHPPLPFFALSSHVTYTPPSSPFHNIESSHGRLDHAHTSPCGLDTYTHNTGRCWRLPSSSQHTIRSLGSFRVPPDTGR